MPMPYLNFGIFGFHLRCSTGFLIRLCIKLISSVIRQKGESLNGVSRKQSMPNFPKNKHFLLPDTHMYVCVSGDKKRSFFGKFGVLCFLETPF